MPTDLRKGEIIGMMKFRGSPAEGEPIIEFSKIYEELRQEAEDSMAKEHIPPGYKNYVKRYFDSINPEQISSAEN